MVQFDVIEIAQRAIVTTLLVTSPILLVSLLTGIVVGFFQSATQIQDQSLSFIPKLISILIVLLVTLPWLIDQLTTYSADMFSQPIGF